MADQSESSVVSREFVELPVTHVVARAFVFPLRHISELWQVSLITLGLFLTINAIGIAFDRLGALRVHSQVQAVLVLFHTVSVTPFGVAWSRIVIDGVEAIGDRRVFTLKEIEGRYALASLVLWLAVLLPWLSFAQLTRIARQAGDETMINLLGLLGIVALLIVVLLLVRMSFLFTGIASDRYNGLFAAWKQTRGYLDTLGAIEGAICVVFVVFVVVARYFRSPHEGNVGWLTRFVGGNIIFLYWQAVFACGPALAYRLIVLRRKLEENLQRPGRTPTVNSSDAAQSSAAR